MNSNKRPNRLFNIYGEDRGTGFAGNVWDTEGLAPTINTMGGGNREPLIMESYEYKTCQDIEKQ